MEHEKSLNATEICAIIRASYKCNVKKLRIKDFEVEFETSPGQSNAAEVFVNQPKGNAIPVAEHVLMDDVEPFTPDRELLEDMRLAQLMTDNPVAYEQEMIDANLDEQVVRDDDKNRI